MKKLAIALTLAIVLFASASSWATTIYVPSDFTTIQEAIDAAVEGDTVLVAPGTYVENINFGEGVGITLMSESGAENTIIDGDQAGSVVTFEKNGTTSLHGFTIQNGNDYYGGGIYSNSASPTITNNVIRNNTSGYYGGGIYAFRGNNVLITNNDVSDNTAGYGGGICIQEASATITGNSVKNNTANAHYGGGIYLYWANTVTVTNNVVTGNSVQNSGGGIYGDQCVSLTIEGNTVSNNTATNGGGGVYWHNYDSPETLTTFTNNVVISNHSGNMGGGIYVSYSTSTINDNTITGNTGGGGMYIYGSAATVNNNTVTENYGGGGIYCLKNTGSVIDNNTVADNGSRGIKIDTSNNVEITNNTITGNGNHGIDLYNDSSLIIGNLIEGNFSEDVYGGGGIFCGDFSSPTIMFNVIKGNEALYDTDGGGIYVDQEGEILFFSNLFVSNKARRGGALYFDGRDSTPTMVNNTVVNNIASENGGAIYLAHSGALFSNNDIFQGNTDDLDISFKINSGAKISFTNSSVGESLIEGDYEMTNPISGDPLLDENYHLSVGSPCIDAGDNSLLPLDTFDLNKNGNVSEYNPFDLNQMERIVDGDVDLGAYEYVLNCDADGDGYNSASTCGGDDCDDNDPTTHPNAEELCDFIDNNCNDIVDDNDTDADVDGFTVCQDCDDLNPNVFPDAPEFPGDGVDSNCNGTDNCGIMSSRNGNFNFAFLLYLLTPMLLIGGLRVGFIQK